MQVIDSNLERLPECCFTSTETVGLLRMGAQDGHLDFHTAPELSNPEKKEEILSRRRVVH